jgi:hypothetical protein
MKTMMMASLVSLLMGSASANAGERKVAAAGNLQGLYRPAAEQPRVESRYSGIERVRDSFRDGSHGRSR